MHDKIHDPWEGRLHFDHANMMQKISKVYIEVSTFKHSENILKRAFSVRLEYRGITLVGSYVLLLWKQMEESVDRLFVECKLMFF